MLHCNPCELAAWVDKVDAMLPLARCVGNCEIAQHA